MTKILVIEDDRSIRMGLVDTLSAKDYKVEAASCGTEGLDLFYRSCPDLVVLDLMLPDMEGFDICKKIKDSNRSDIPIIMLTARGAELDRVRGFDLGADDYVTKPFSLMELLARIRAVLRRYQLAKKASHDIDRLILGDVEIDFLRHSAKRGSQSLKISDRGFVLLRVLARHQGEVISRERLLEDVWGAKRTVNTRTIDNHIVQLRKMIEDDPNLPKYLITVHGVGYKLTESNAG